MGMILGRERERFETRAQANLDSLVELSGQRQATYAASIIERMANWTRGQLGSSLAARNVHTRRVKSMIRLFISMMREQVNN